MIGGAIIAAVDTHGRDRLARPLLCILFAALACALPAAQTPAPAAPSDDLRAELASKIAAAGATAASVSCQQNLRERTCVADVITKGGARDVMMVSRPIVVRAVREPALGLDARPLFAQRTPILDVATAPDGKRIIVLEPDAVAIRQWTPAGDASDVIDSRAVQTNRARPRDARGRVAAAQLPYDLFLPGVTCRGDLDPLRVSCTDDSAPWPGLANAGVEAARNFFTTPEGRTFVSAAAVADGRSRWLVADPQGGLALFDQARSLIGKLPATGDDVAAVRAPCAARSFVVVSNRVAREGGDLADADELRLFRVAGRELVLSATPLRLPGTLTALWGSETSPSATAVVHDVASDRYEAFQIRVSCAR